MKSFVAITDWVTKVTEMNFFLTVLEAKVKVATGLQGILCLLLAPTDTHTLAHTHVHFT